MRGAEQWRELPRLSPTSSQRALDEDLGAGRRRHHAGHHRRADALRVGRPGARDGTASSPGCRSPALRVRRRSARAGCGSSSASADGARVERGRRAGHRPRPGARPAHRRAHRAEPARPPLRHRHPHPPVGRRGRRAPARGSATPARRSPACARWRSTRCAAAAGVNHRMSLSDAALVKDNHVAAAGGVVAGVRAGPRGLPGLPLEVEVDTVEQAREVIDAGADLVLLDNMTPRRDARGRRARRRPRQARGVRRAATRRRPRGGRDRRRLPCRRRAHPLGAPSSTSAWTSRSARR